MAAAICKVDLETDFKVVEVMLVKTSGISIIGSRDLRQMSEYPIPHGGQHHFFILRRWKPAFLHLKGEIQICHRADKQNALKIVPFPHKGAN
jgi:hypothetical protein